MILSSFHARCVIALTLVHFTSAGCKEKSSSSPETQYPTATQNSQTPPRQNIDTTGYLATSPEPAMNGAPSDSSVLMLNVPIPQSNEFALDNQNPNGTWNWSIEIKYTTPQRAPYKKEGTLTVVNGSGTVSASAVPNGKGTIALKLGQNGADIFAGDSDVTISSAKSSANVVLYDQRRPLNINANTGGPNPINDPAGESWNQLVNVPSDGWTINFLPR